uniref:Uncharacterized protein n=1 Tax=Plectus sambesii TaxID=2011161 RepID=A0A914VIY5_9BILA
MEGVGRGRDRGNNNRAGRIESADIRTRRRPFGAPFSAFWPVTFATRARQVRGGGVRGGGLRDDRLATGDPRQSIPLLISSFVQPWAPVGGNTSATPPCRSRAPRRDVCDNCARQTNCESEWPFRVDGGGASRPAATVVAPLQGRGKSRRRMRKRAGASVPVIQFASSSTAVCNATFGSSRWTEEHTGQPARLSVSRPHHPSQSRVC